MDFWKPPSVLEMLGVADFCERSARLVNTLPEVNFDRGYVWQSNGQHINPAQYASAYKNKHQREP